MGIIAEYVRLGNGIDFAGVNRTAIGYLPSLVRTWLPQGQRRGREWVALNPTRPDKHPGSFSVNLNNGKWADFATGDRGGDVVSLAAYVFGTSQADAARSLAAALGVDWRDRP
jgi:hypothetical protein